MLYNKTAFPLLLLLLITSINTTYAQPEVEWINFYGGEGYQTGEGFVITEDNGFAICGATNRQFWLTRTDEEGEPVWTHIYDSEGEGSEAYDLVQAQDGGFLMVGIAYIDGPYSNWLAIRVNAIGEELWRETYGGEPTPASWPDAVVVNKDEEYVIVGSQSIPNEGLFARAIKIDDDGQVIWQNDYGEDNSYFHDIVIAPGGYAICGSTRIEQRNQAWLVRINEDGEVGLQETYGIEEEGERALGLVLTRENGFTLTGIRTVGENACDYFIVNTDANGDVNWQQTYDLDRWEWSCAIVQQADGGFTSVGQHNVGDDAYNGHVINVDAGGDLQWDFSEGEPFYFGEFTDVKIHPVDGSTVLGGYSYTGDNNTLIDAILVKMTPVNHPPEIMNRNPEDSIVYILVEQDTLFSIDADDIDNDEITIEWFLGEEIAGNEEAIILNLPEAGEFDLRVDVSDWQFTTSANWLIRALNLVTGFEPETLNVNITENDSIDFVIHTGVEYDSLSVNWTLDGNPVDADTSVTIDFPDTGEYLVQAVAGAYNLQDTVRWQVIVQEEDFVDESPEPVADAFFLSEPYPNPFNGAAQVYFNLPVETHTILTLHNLKGEYIREVLSGDLSAGNYRIDIIPGEIPAGVYFLRLETGRFTFTRKLIYMP